MSRYYLILGILGMYLLMFFIFKRSKPHETKLSWNGIMLAANVILVFVIFFFCSQYYFRTGWDAGILVNNAAEIAKGNYSAIEHFYFSRWPNNVVLTYIFSLVIRFSNFCGFQDYYLALIGYQCILYGAAGYLTYYNADLLFKNKRWAIWAWIIYVGLVGFSPWVSIPYSDSTALFFVALLIMVFLHIREKKSVRLHLFLLGFLGWLGYKIKPQVFLALLAIVFFQCLSAVFHKKCKLLLKKMLFVGCGMIAAAVLVSGITKLSHIEINKELSYGPAHYLMMGIRYETRGTYSAEDVKFSAGFEYRDERTKGNLEVYKQRLDDYSVKEILQLMYFKTLINYNDGTFAWECEGEFYPEDFSLEGDGIGAVLRNYYLQDGEYYQIYLLLVQSLWLSVLFFSIFAVFSKRNEKLLPLFLIVLALTAFQLIFEARARYLFSFVPIYILLAGAGLERISSR